MYSPRHNREDDPETLVSFMRENRFATLVTVGPGNAPRATHLPFVVRADTDGLRLVAHMARANPQWEDFAAGREALAIFQGPHAYISPEHYEQPISVPTWNYIAVHAYGVPCILETLEERRAAVDLLIAQEEAGFADRMAGYPDEFVQGKLRAIVAFQIPVSRMEARFKLSQDRTENDRHVISLALSGSPHEAERRIAARMTGL